MEERVKRKIKNYFNTISNALAGTISIINICRIYIVQ
jgi:hypothetical protein